MQSSLSAKIIRNVLSSGFRAVLVAPIPFVMTPLILRKIGTSGYGTWAVLLAFNSLSSMADLGMVGTVSKYVAEYYAHRDLKALNRLVNTGLAIFTGLSLSLGVLFWVGSPLVVRILFKGSSFQANELASLFRFFLIVISTNILSMLLASVTSGLQRLDISNWIIAANSLCAAVLGGALLLRGWGLRGLVVGQVCAALSTVVAYGVIVRKLLPETVLRPAHVSVAEAKKLFGFSLRLYITQAAVAVHNQLEKFLLALFVGVAAAGWYDIASDMALKFRGIVGLVLGPILPAASELDARNDEQRTAELYYRAHKYIAFLGLPGLFYFSVISRKFVELWIGPKLVFVALPLAVLMWINFYNLLTGPGFLILAGRAYLRPGLQSALLGLILNVVLSFVLIYRFGFAGAVLGTSLSLLFASTFFMYLFHVKTGYSVGRLIRDAYLKPFTTAAALALPTWLVLRALTPSWTILIVLGVAFGVLYVTAIFLNNFLDQYEWAKIEGLIPATRHFRRIIPIA